VDNSLCSQDFYKDNFSSDERRVNAKFSTAEENGMLVFNRFVLLTAAAAAAAELLSHLSPQLLLPLQIEITAPFPAQNL
jgi:hypothetical protein